jgi:hypothetical protein
MDMIDAYVSEIGQRLPARQRVDIEREIRSMIGDTLDDESQAQNRPIDDDMVAQVLKRLGSPQKVAASYIPPQYLIGPELFPAYLTVVKIVLSVLVVLAIVGLALLVGLAGTVQSQVLEPLARASGGIFSGIIQAFGIITIVFAVLQRVAPKNQLVQEEAEFDPRKLKLKPDTEKISPPGLVVEIVFTFIGIILFSVFPQVIGVGSYNSGQWVIVPVLSQAFFGYLPYLVALWVAQAALKSAVLAGGRWTEPTRWINVGLNILSIVLVSIILQGPSLVTLPPDIVTTLGWGKADPLIVANLGNIFDASIRLALLVALIVESIETISTFVKLVLRARSVPVAD